MMLTSKSYVYNSLAIRKQLLLANKTRIVFAPKYYCITVSVLLICLLMSGCATLKKEECLTADWVQFGYEDGLKGYELDRIGKHRKACAKYGVKPDMEAYSNGRSKGLTFYCTPVKGYDLGRKGRTFPTVCPEKLAGEFRNGYEAGRQIYLKTREIESYKNILETVEQDIDRINKEIKKREANLQKDCKNKTLCKSALNRIRELDREKLERIQEAEDLEYE
ncbi:MAG: DUF2799 domain-containing protein, partial [Desulfobacterales bacterium]|nr:DUF2799 domain-containing protein [Desulfobacterales bacterium]